LIFIFQTHIHNLAYLCNQTIDFHFEKKTKHEIKIMEIYASR